MQIDVNVPLTQAEIEAKRQKEIALGAVAAMATMENQQLASPKSELTEAQRLEAEPGATPPTYVDPERPEVRDGWGIQSLEDFDWALERLADLEREKAENERLVEQRIAWEKLRLEKLNKTANDGARFLESCVKAYAEAHRGELLGKGKKKSRALPHGVIGWRSKGGGLVVKDAEALLAWAKLQPVELELVRVKTEPAIANIKAHAKSTGEVPDGCETSEAVDEFYVEPIAPVGL